MSSQWCHCFWWQRMYLLITSPILGGDSYTNQYPKFWEDRQDQGRCKEIMCNGQHILQPSYYQTLMNLALQLIFVLYIILSRDSLVKFLPLPEVNGISFKIIISRHPFKITKFYFQVSPARSGLWCIYSISRDCALSLCFWFSFSVLLCLGCFWLSTSGNGCVAQACSHAHVFKYWYYVMALCSSSRWTRYPFGRQAFIHRI